MACAGGVLSYETSLLAIANTRKFSFSCDYFDCVLYKKHLAFKIINLANIQIRLSRCFTISVARSADFHTAGAQTLNHLTQSDGQATYAVVKPAVSAASVTLSARFGDIYS